MLVLLLYAVVAVTEACPPCDVSTCTQVLLLTCLLSCLSQGTNICMNVYNIILVINSRY